MTPQAKDTQSVSFRQDDFQQFVRDTMRDFVRIALTTILEEEVTTLIGAAPYEQNPTRRDYRNGSYTRDLDTSVGRLEDLRVPRTRRGFRTQVFERYQRRRPEVDASIGEMFIAGVSTTGVGRVVEDLTGVKPSLTVFRAFFINWKTSSNNGKNANSKSTTFIVSRTAPISASFMTTRAAKRRF